MLAINVDSGIPQRQAGLTIVEVVVAGTLLGLVFTAVMSMIASGRDMETAEYLRRQAMHVAVSLLESPEYHHSNYVLMAGKSPTYILKSETNLAVPATVIVTVSAETSVPFQDPGSGFIPAKDVKYKRVSAQIAWDFASRKDTVELSKRVANYK